MRAQAGRQVLEEYLHTLEEAVRCRLRSRGRRVAIELSGGLDSPAIACLAARLSDGSGPELHTLSLVFDELPEVNERDRIQKVLDRYPLAPHFIAADQLYTMQCFSPDWSPRSVVGPHEIMTTHANEQLYDVESIQEVRQGKSGESEYRVRWSGFFEVPVAMLF